MFLGVKYSRILTCHILSYKHDKNDNLMFQNKHYDLSVLFHLYILIANPRYSLQVCLQTIEKRADSKKENLTVLPYEYVNASRHCLVTFTHTHVETLVIYTNMCYIHNLRIQRICWTLEYSHISNVTYPSLYSGTCTLSQTKTLSNTTKKTQQTVETFEILCVHHHSYRWKLVKQRS